MYVYDYMQMQLRDYPHPLLDITEITIHGRMMFAEQEAQERGMYVIMETNGGNQWINVANCVHIRHAWYTIIILIAIEISSICGSDMCLE